MVVKKKLSGSKEYMLHGGKAVFASRVTERFRLVSPVCVCGCVCMCVWVCMYVCGLNEDVPSV